MRSSYSVLMQSKYYSPSFNSAVFDGPLRIYFAQMHESLALKIYFMTQQKGPQEYSRAKEYSKISKSNVLIMVYPDDESFRQAMSEGRGPHWRCESWGQELVIGLSAGLEDSRLEEFIQFVAESMAAWALVPLSLAAGSEMQLR